MLITRAPVRISLAGGGTDLPAYYEAYGGAVLNTTIDKYFYTILNVLEKDTVQVTSSDYRTFYRHENTRPIHWDGDLELPRVILDHFGIRKGLSLFMASEIPPGTGLGSSSTVAVAIIKAASTALGHNLSKGELAELACHIEIDQLKAPIGKQDQYAAAYGGLNFIKFEKDEISIEPVRLPPQVYQALDRNLLLFFSGSSRSASKILAKQTRSSQKQDPIVIDALHKVKEMAYDVLDALVQGDLPCFAELLHQNWVQKKQFAKGVSNPKIDEAYELARQKGALGGKITGAGGGGFLMLYVEPPEQNVVTKSLEENGFKRLDFRFESMGARVLMNSGLSIPTSIWD
ncbi:MAG: GHMP kinase [Anaerolineales bacterium]|uniref:GHMP kinase n=1 Tax=Candidatus Desulfolinea nitratireducens TaxID=2841698 RepID=A0A8J6NMP0_9CHLR|nr:GHMP kinase [Candidatus Desulfolinea nitratireducens]